MASGPLYRLRICARIRDTSLSAAARACQKSQFRLSTIVASLKSLQISNISSSSPSLQILLKLPHRRSQANPRIKPCNRARRSREIHYQIWVDTGWTQGCLGRIRRDRELLADSVENAVCRAGVEELVEGAVGRVEAGDAAVERGRPVQERTIVVLRRRVYELVPDFIIDGREHAGCACCGDGCSG